MIINLNEKRMEVRILSNFWKYLVSESLLMGGPNIPAASMLKVSFSFLSL